MIGTVSLILLIMWALFLFAIYSENDIFIFLAAAGMILISVYIMVYGLEGMNNWLTRGVAVIHIGLGFIGLFAPLWYSLNIND
jgi:hypothetical protein